MEIIILFLVRSGVMENILFNSIFKWKDRFLLLSCGGEVSATVRDREFYSVTPCWFVRLRLLQIHQLLNNESAVQSDK